MNCNKAKPIIMTMASVKADSKVNIVLIASGTLSLVINGMTTEELTPARTTPKSRLVKELHRNTEYVKIVVRKIESTTPTIVNNMALGVSFITFCILMFRPPSNRIMIKARTMKTWEIGANSSGLIVPKTGPSKIPTIISIRMSGIPVLSKRYRPIKPMTTIMPASAKAKTTIVIFYFLFIKFV